MKHDTDTRYDRIIFGAGIYGLYSAISLAKQGLSVAVVDADAAPFLRGSYVNQARIHNGYHYPRSYSTASKSARYFERFNADYADSILFDFDKIYAVSAHFSWTNGSQFAKFCRDVNIRCDEMTNRERYFNPHAVEKAFYTTEYTFDAKLIGEKMYNEATNLGVVFKFLGTTNNDEVSQDGGGAGPEPSLTRARPPIMGGHAEPSPQIVTPDNGGDYRVIINDCETLVTSWILNATYAGVNAIHKLAGFEPLNIKYELCEVILVNVSGNIKDVGLTVMDGPFFSLMPFGKTGYHSLTTVSRTPHITSYDPLPTFPCQQKNPRCTPENMQNCNRCPVRPQTAFVEMKQMAKKYLHPDIKIEYVESLFALKPILKASEIDDSRPTLVRQYSEKPCFYTVFSGKINTIYDLDGILV